MRWCMDAGWTAGGRRPRVPPMKAPGPRHGRTQEQAYPARLPPTPTPRGVGCAEVAVTPRTASGGSASGTSKVGRGSTPRRGGRYQAIPARAGIRRFAFLWRILRRGCFRTRHRTRGFRGRGQRPDMRRRRGSRFIEPRVRQTTCMGTRPLASSRRRHRLLVQRERVVQERRRVKDAPTREGPGGDARQCGHFFTASLLASGSWQTCIGRGAHRTDGGSASGGVATECEWNEPRVPASPHAAYPAPRLLLSTAEAVGERDGRKPGTASDVSSFGTIEVGKVKAAPTRKAPPSDVCPGRHCSWSVQRRNGSWTRRRTRGSGERGRRLGRRLLFGLCFGSPRPAAKHPAYPAAHLAPAMTPSVCITASFSAAGDGIQRHRGCSEQGREATPHRRGRLHRAMSAPVGISAEQAVRFGNNLWMWRGTRGSAGSAAPLEASSCASKRPKNPRPASPRSPGSTRPRRSRGRHQTVDGRSRFRSGMAPHRRGRRCRMDARPGEQFLPGLAASCVD
ncbi:hypothetical protein DFJ74DRAFT_57298 [Hyaloraphidium curvatum]|nr:hypothetical protein DFJ74DRAFT_57298 [Hyaloraphidium curvatum]